MCFSLAISITCVKFTHTMDTLSFYLRFHLSFKRYKSGWRLRSTIFSLHACFFNKSIILLSNSSGVGLLPVKKGVFISKVEKLNNLYFLVGIITCILIAKKGCLPIQCIMKPLFLTVLAYFVCDILTWPYTMIRIYTSDNIS